MCSIFLIKLQRQQTATFAALYQLKQGRRHGHKVGTLKRSRRRRRWGKCQRHENEGGVGADGVSRWGLGNGVFSPADYREYGGASWAPPALIAIFVHFTCYFVHSEAYKFIFQDQPRMSSTPV